MFKPDETAKEFFRRLTLPTIKFPFGSLNFGEVVEIQIEYPDIEQTVLNIIFEFFVSSGDHGFCYHASTSKSLYHSLVQGGVNLEGTPLLKANDDGRLLQCQIFNMKHLDDLFQTLTDINNPKPTLLLLETLSPVFYAEKVHYTSIISFSK